MSPSKRQRREQRIEAALNAPPPSRLPRWSTVRKWLIFLAVLAVWLLVCYQVAQAAGLWDEHCRHQGGTLGASGFVGAMACTLPWLGEGPAGIALFLLIWLPGILVAWIAARRARTNRQRNRRWG